jgi:molybdopterin-containing oxidoreductase family iron-sulfur binding subunit
MHLLYSAHSARQNRVRKENRTIRDGEVQTACMSVCPADAIVFGNMNDENSRVRKMKEYERDYGL